MSDERPVIEVSVKVPFDEGQRVIEVLIPVEYAWILEESIFILGRDRAAIIAGIGAELQRRTMAARMSETDDPEDKMMMRRAISKVLPTADQREVIRTVMEMMEEELYGRHWPTLRDRVFDFTRHQLQDHKMTWARAAEIASRALNREYSPDAYRKKLDRWVKQNGLPPVAVYTRKEPTL